MKFELLILHIILTITMACYQDSYIFSQNASFKEIILPQEIKTINALKSNHQDELWLATGQGLYCYKNDEFIRYFDNNAADLYCINIFEFDKPGNIWYGTYNGLLVKFDKHKIIKTIDIKAFSKTDNYLITSISIDKEDKNKNNEILLTTSGGEIFSADTITDEVKNIKSPSDGTIYAIQYGYATTIWLCTSDGFYTSNRNWKWKKKSDLYTAYGLYENEDKYWTIGRDENKKAVLMLYYNQNFEGDAEKFVWRKFDLQKLSNLYIRFYQMGFTSSEKIWLASEIGLVRYNPLNADVIEYKNYRDSQLGAIQNITIQNDKLIWMSTSGKKLFRVDLN